MRRLIVSGRRLLLDAARDQIEAEQPAFECAVVKRRLRRIAQTQLARQLAVGRQNKRVPASEALLERIAERLEELAIRCVGVRAPKAFVALVAAGRANLAARAAAAHLDPFAVRRI